MSISETLILPCRWPWAYQYRALDAHHTTQSPSRNVLHSNSWISSVPCDLAGKSLFKPGSLAVAFNVYYSSWSWTILKLSWSYKVIVGLAIMLNRHVVWGFGHCVTGCNWQWLCKYCQEWVHQCFNILRLHCQGYCWWAHTSNLLFLSVPGAKWNYLFSCGQVQVFMNCTRPNSKFDRRVWTAACNWQNSGLCSKFAFDNK